MSVADVQEEFNDYKKSTDRKLKALEQDNADLRSQLKALSERFDALDGKAGSRPASAASRPGSAAPRPTSAAAAKPAVTRNGSTAKPAATPAAAAAKAGPKLSSASGVKKSPSLPDSIAKVDIAPERIKSYQVGKRKVYYIVPSDFDDSKENANPPGADLALQWVYGYNGKAASMNLFYQNPDSAASPYVYCIAGTGVVYDVGAQKQKFFLGHNEDILSQAYHAGTKLCATGQLDPKGKGKPFACVWNTDTMEEVARLENFHDRGICGLAFSGDGKQILSVGNDDGHTAALWNIDDAKAPIAQGSTNKDDIFGVVVNPYASELEFVSLGKKVVKHFRVEGKVLKGTALSTMGKDKVVQTAYQAATFLPSGDLVLGSDSGFIFHFKGTTLQDKYKAHEGAVSAITETKSGFATGGADGKVCTWDSNFQKLATYDIPKNKTISALSFNSGSGALLVGTVHNAIFEIDTRGTASQKMDGHFNEIWGCAVHPNGRYFVTTGHDKVLRAWDYSTHQPVAGKIVSLSDKAGSAAFSPDGRSIAVGTSSGKVIIVDFDTFQVKYDKAHRKEQIDAIAYSPNGQILAVGSWDQCAELIDLESKSSVTLKGHTSSVTHLSFSVDSKYLTTCSRDYEILYWDTETGKRVDKSIAADAEWYDFNCVLGFPVRGVFSKGQDGTDVNAAHVSWAPDAHNRLVVTGNDTGYVSLHRYPAHSDGIKQYHGHSAHVTNVRFSRDDKFVFSTGGNDLAVMQWAVQK